MNNSTLLPNILTDVAYSFPLALLTLSFEINFVRNVLLIEFVMLVLWGGVLSLFFTMVLSAAAQLHAVDVAIAAEVLEEVAKMFPPSYSR